MYMLYFADDKNVFPVFYHYKYRTGLEAFRSWP